MGYQEQYIIDNDTDIEEPVVQKPMETATIRQNKVSDDFKPIEPVSQSEEIINEIHEAAVAEGLVDDSEVPFGGEGTPSPQDVIADFTSQKRTEGAQKNYEEYADQKVEKTKKIMATREILTGMTKRLITTSVEVVLDMPQEDGSVEPELVDLELKIKRLTESQVNHLFNRRMAGKTVEDMTPEELQEDNHFRSNFLAQTVVEPQMDADVWYNEVPAIATGVIFNKVNDVLSSIDNTDLFQ